MVNSRQRPIRFMRGEAVPRQRIITPRVSLQSAFISRSRFATIERNKQKAVNNIIGRLNLTNDINEQKKILDSAPSNIRTQIEQIRSQIKLNQDKTITQLEKDSKLNEDNLAKSRYRVRRAKNEHERQRYEEAIDKYEARFEALNKIIKDMKTGKSYSYSSIAKYIADVGRVAGRRKGAKIEFIREQAKAQKIAEFKATQEISKAGLVNVINEAGKLIGYQTMGANPTQYRFDKRGVAKFYSSPEFKPIILNNRVVGYTDNIAKQSIPITALKSRMDKYRLEQEKIISDYNKLQSELKKIKLPSRYSFDRDKQNNIIGFSDSKLGISRPLYALVDVPFIKVPEQIAKEIKKIKVEALTKFFKQDEFAKYYPKPIKWYDTNKWISYTADKQYYLYKKNQKGTLSKSEFLTIRNSIGLASKRWNNFLKHNPSEAKRITNALSDSLTDQIQHPEKYGTTQRLNALLSIGGAVGGSVVGLSAFGTVYHGTLGFAKDVYANQLPKDFKKIGLLIVKNFGYGALQGFIYGSMFAGGSALWKKVGRKLIPMRFLKGGISKVTQLAIKRGLSILGINYISRLAGRTAFNIKNIAIGDVPTGVSELFKDLGTLVGFFAPTFIVKRIRAGSKDLRKIKVKKDGTVKLSENQRKEILKEIRTLEKFRRGQINSAYLKAKTAQLADPTRGGFKSSGIVKKLNKNAVNSLSKIASQKGITQGQLLDGSYYSQIIKIKSKLPETEAFLKFYKSLLRGKIIKIKPVSKFYVFKRYGVVVARTTKAGTVEAFSIEFNYIGGKVSNIGFKTAVGKNKITAIKVYKKIKAVKGKPLRVKFQDLFLVKNKLETRIPSEKGMIKIFNKLETKKVLLNNKKLSISQILNIKSAIKKDFTLSKKVNLESLLKILYKDKRVTSKSGFTNVMRIQRIKDIIKVIPAYKKTPIRFKIFPKGQYIEIGFTKFRIPSVKPSKIIKIKVKPKKVVRPTKKIKLIEKSIIVKPITIKQIKAPVRSLQIQVKKGISITKIRNVETAIKSIQTIIRPRVRAGKLTKIIPISLTKTIIRQIAILLPLVSTKNAQAMKNIQSNLRVSLSIQIGKQINQTRLIQIRSLQNVSVNALQNIYLIKPITPTIIIPAIPRIRKPTRPTKKPPVIIEIPKVISKKRVIKKRGEFGYTSSLIRDRKKKRLNKIPISKEKAFDIVAYTLSRSRLEIGKVSKSPKEVKLSTLKRKVASIPAGYFRKNRSRFIVRKLKTRIESYEIIKKVLVPRPKSIPRKKPSRKPTKKRKSIIPKAKVIPKRRTTKKSKPTKKTRKRRIKRK